MDRDQIFFFVRSPSFLHLILIFFFLFVSLLDLVVPAYRTSSQAYNRITKTKKRNVKGNKRLGGQIKKKKKKRITIV